jgi:hypothetical protein
MYASPALIIINAVPHSTERRRNNPPFRYVLIAEHFLGPE